MNDDLKGQALTTWHELLMNPAIRMNAQEQYEELIRLADNFREKGIIDLDERKTLIDVATVSYARAVEGGEPARKSASRIFQGAAGIKEGEFFETGPSLPGFHARAY